MTPAEDSGTSCQAPSRSRIGSETMNRVSSPSLFKISSSGWTRRNGTTSVEKNSDLLSCSLEYRKAQTDRPSVVATVICTGCSTVRVPDLLHEPDGPLDSAERVVVQPEGEGEEDQ